MHLNSWQCVFQPEICTHTHTFWMNAKEWQNTHSSHISLAEAFKCQYRGRLYLPKLEQIVWYFCHLDFQFVALCSRQRGRRREMEPTYFKVKNHVFNLKYFSLSFFILLFFCFGFHFIGSFSVCFHSLHCLFRPFSLFSIALPLSI